MRVQRAENTHQKTRIRRRRRYRGNAVRDRGRELLGGAPRHALKRAPCRLQRDRRHRAHLRFKVPQRVSATSVFGCEEWERGREEVLASRVRSPPRKRVQKSLIEEGTHTHTHTLTQI